MENKSSWNCRGCRHRKAKDWKSFFLYLSVTWCIYCSNYDYTIKAWVARKTHVEEPFSNANQITIWSDVSATYGCLPQRMIDTYRQGYINTNWAHRQWSGHVKHACTVSNECSGKILKWVHRTMNNTGKSAEHKKENKRVKEEYLEKTKAQCSVQ